MERDPIFVNFEALTELAYRLENIQSTFEAMAAHPSVDGGAVANAALADELASYLDGWSQGREQIGSSMRAVIGAVGKALTTYREADNAIAAAEGSGSLTAGTGQAQ